MQRKYSLDFLKLIFISVIVLHHTTLFEGQLIRGYIGVEFFFMVSGYFLYNSYSNDTARTTLHYIKGRILRLYPQYLVAYIILAICVGVGGNYVYTAKHQFLLEIIMLTDVRWGLNYPCWYLTILLVGSLMLYGAIRIISKKYHCCALLCALGCYICLFLHNSNIEQWDWNGNVLYFPLLRGVGALLLGMFVCMTQQMKILRMDKTKRWAQYLEIILFIAIMILLVLKGNYDFLQVLLIFLLMLITVRHETIMNYIGRLKAVQFLVKYEYAMYLNHNLIIRVVKTILQNKIQNKLILTILIFVTLIIYSFIITELIEILLKYYNKNIRVIKDNIVT